MAFMFETRAVVRPRLQALDAAHRQTDYQAVWQRPAPPVHAAALTRGGREPERVASPDYTAVRGRRPRFAPR